MPRILLSLLLVALMCCCVKNGSELVCNNPYIQVGNECCLDRNDNNICDKDEITAMTTSTTTATTTTATSTTTTAAPSTANTEPTVKEREVVLVIDTSGSMNESVVNTPQQAAALGIVNQLNDNDKVAVVEFKGNASIIEHVKKLSEGRKEIKEKIQNLQFGLGTILNQALDKAYWALQEYSLSGDKYVIIISDGVYSGRDFNQSLQEIHSLVAKNITFYTVGVGPYTEEQTLLGLAKAGKGRYYKPDDYGGLIAEIDK